MFFMISGQWQSAYDNDGNIYYYNTTTGVSQYEDPNIQQTTNEWAEAYDENGIVYYYNTTTGVSQYESPY